MSPSAWRSSSGEAPTTSSCGVRTKNRYGLGLTRRSERYRPIPSSRRPVVGSVGRPNDWRRASTTWIASPAAMASLATSTARTYSSRPRLVSMGSLSAVPPFVRVAGPASSAALGRAVFSSASKIAASAIRYRPSRSAASVCRDAIADSVWVRWSKTRTRSVSMKAAIGTPIGSRSGSGTVGSKAETASYEIAPTAPPVNRGIPSVGSTRRRGTKARIAARGSGASAVSIGRSGV